MTISASLPKDRKVVSILQNNRVFVTTDAFFTKKQYTLNRNLLVGNKFGFSRQ